MSHGLFFDDLAYYMPLTWKTPSLELDRYISFLVYANHKVWGCSWKLATYNFGVRGTREFGQRKTKRKKEICRKHDI